MTEASLTPPPNDPAVGLAMDDDDRRCEIAVLLWLILSPGINLSRILT